MGLVFEGAWIFFGTGIVFGALARARIYLSIITKPKSVLVVNLSRLFHINITNIRSKKRI